MTDSVVLPGVGGGMKSMNETYWGELKKKMIYLSIFGYTLSSLGELREKTHTNDFQSDSCE